MNRYVVAVALLVMVGVFAVMEDAVAQKNTLYIARLTRLYLKSLNVAGFAVGQFASASHFNKQLTPAEIADNERLEKLK